MMLISPAAAALAIGARCGASAPAQDDEGLMAILNLITPRVEAALDVLSLTIAETEEVFTVPESVFGLSFYRHLRTANGFIVPGSVQVISPDEIELVRAIDYHYQPEEGIITLINAVAGEYTVTYVSGFAPEVPTVPAVDTETDNQVLVGVPAWIKGIVVDLLVMWYRSQALAPKVVKDVNYAEVTDVLQRDLRTRIYNRYTRPRTGMIFGERRGAF